VEEVAEDQRPVELPDDIGALSNAIRETVDNDEPVEEVAEDQLPVEFPDDIGALSGAIRDAVDNDEPVEEVAEDQRPVELPDDIGALSNAIRAAVDNDQPPGDVPKDEPPAEFPDGLGAAAGAIGERGAHTPAGDEGSAPVDGDEPPPAEGEAGMTVHDDVTPPPMNCCVHSVSHLPPLVTSDETDGISEYLLANFLESGAIPNVDRRLQLIQYLQRQKVNALCINNFVEARRLHSVLQDFQRVLLRARTQDFHEQRLEALQAKQRDAAERLAQFREETDAMMHEEDQFLAERLLQLSNQHAEQLNNFDKRWNNPDYLLRFAKPSSYLLQIIKIERSLVLSKDLEQAEFYRAKVAQLEKEESEAAQRSAEAKMRAQHVRIIARHEAEVSALKEQGVKSLELLRSQREQEERALIIRLKTIEGELELVRANRPLGLPTTRSNGSVQECSMTPRTLQRYAAFKTNVIQPRVIVRPLGAIKMMKRPRKPFGATLAGSY
jgi:hypothetical protein